MRFWIACLLLFSGLPALADTVPIPTEGSAWLEQVARATQQTDYQGVFVYQHQEHMEISHIAHRMDRNGEMARLDTLSGPPKSFLRENNAVYCYIPDGRKVNIERHRHHPFFPEILPQSTGALLQWYQIRPLGHTTIAGRDATGMALMPRDAYRYGYLLWADSSSNVLLRMVKLDAQGQPIAQFSFTQVEIGTAPDRGQFQANFIDRKTISLPDRETPIRTGWKVDNLPPGFRLITENQLTLPNKSEPAVHMVYSDGLATVSLFVEADPHPGAQPKRGLFSENALTLYIRTTGDNQITALGEVPPATLMMMADSLENTGKK